MASHFKHASNFSIERIINTNVSAETYIHHSESSPSNRSIEKLRGHIAVGALHNSAERCDAPKCHPETRVAVQDEIVGWLLQGDSDDEPKKIMWVTGPAGTGKTAVMGSVGDTCQGKGILAGAFFFSSLSGSVDRRSKRCFVPTLAYQLVQHEILAPVAEQILLAVDRNPAVFGQKLEVQLDQLILDPLRACRNHSERLEWPKTIIIDGLDECEAEQYHDTARRNAPLRSKEDDQTEILLVLKKAASDPDFPFRIVIASRPEHVIKLFFTDFAKSMTRELFLDDKYNPDADMGLFLESKFAYIRRQCHLPSSWPSGDVRRTLIANASGQFIYVATVGRFMQGSHGDPDELLNQVLRLPGIQTSTNPLAPLDWLYTHILNSSPDPRLSILWLNLIFREKYLEGPSRRSQNSTEPKIRAPAPFVRLFLESYPGQASHVFRNLNSLVSIPSMKDDNSPYRLYHKSLVDFLQEKSRSGNLHVESKVVLKLFVDRYLHLWKTKGPERSLTPQERSNFFMKFFSHGLYAKVFSAKNLGSFDKIILPSDVPWWVRSFLKENQGWDGNSDAGSIEGLFCGVHTMCHWYARCRPSCRYIRSEVVKTLTAADWKTPSRSHLLRHRFSHLEEEEAGFEAPMSPLTWE